jgi:hypothetical protein
MEDEQVISNKGYLAILIAIAIIFLIGFYLKTKKTSEIKNNFNKTLGTLTNYKDATGVEGTNIVIEYKYWADSKRYSRKTQTMVKYQMCQDNPSNCIGKRYWVIYQMDNPGNSLINLKFELKGDSTLFPSSLDNFF